MLAVGERGMAILLSSALALELPVRNEEGL